MTHLDTQRNIDAKTHKHTDTHTHRKFTVTHSHTLQSAEPVSTAMLLVAMVLLLACTRLLPGKGTNALPGKGILFAALVLALAMAVPGEGILGFILAMAVPAQGSNFLCWWRLRELDGQLWFVWPSGYWEQVGSFWEEAIDANSRPISVGIHVPIRAAIAAPRPLSKRSTHRC